VNRAVFVLALRLRLVAALLAASGMATVILLVGALFPSVGGTIGKLHVPEGVANLLGGADYGTITGWMRSEIGAVYGPLVVAASAITAAVASTAGEEEAGILAVVLAHPVERGRLVLDKAAATAIVVVIVGLGTWIGLVLGVLAAGGGISVADVTALVVHLVGFGLAVGALALALATTTGRKTVAAAGAAAVAIASFLLSGFAPLLSGLTWLKYLSLFYYYSGHDPIGGGVDVGGLGVLALAACAFTAVAVMGLRQRDLRA
jgi:ABC-2 type transport system permease protein